MIPFQCSQTLIKGLDPVAESFSLLFDFLGLAQVVVDGVSVDFVEKDHVKSVLALTHQEEADNFGDAIIHHVHHDSKVVVESLPDFFDEELIGLCGVTISGFLHQECSTARRSSL